MPTPEDQARANIDHLLTQAGWAVQDKNAVNLSALRGVAVRELSFKTGEPDYTLFVNGKAIGTVEAKPEGHSLIGVEEQSEKYVKGVPFGLPAWHGPDSELRITIKDKLFVAEGTYEVTRAGLGLQASLLGFPSPPATKDQFHVIYNGKIYGHAVVADVKREELSKLPGLPTVLGDFATRRKALMIVSQTLENVRVCEKESSSKSSFYTLTRFV